MGIKKIDTETLLTLCAKTFKRYGYHGTTMNLLAAACNQTKSSFYYHYSGKEKLIQDILEWHRERRQQMFKKVQSAIDISPTERLKMMGQFILEDTVNDSIGHLSSIIGSDTAYLSAELQQLISNYLDEYSAQFTRLLVPLLGDKDAPKVAEAIVSDYEGAAILARLKQSGRPIEDLINRLSNILSSPSLARTYAGITS